MTDKGSDAEVGAEQEAEPETDPVRARTYFAVEETAKKPIGDEPKDPREGTTPKR